MNSNKETFKFSYFDKYYVFIFFNKWLDSIYTNDEPPFVSSIDKLLFQGKGITRHLLVRIDESTEGDFVRIETPVWPSNAFLIKSSSVLS